MTTEQQRAHRAATRAIAGAWLWDHIGRLTGLFLGLLTLVALGFLAAIGYSPALGLLLVVVVGVLLIAIGGRMRGGR